MKKIFYVVAVMALVFTSCSEKETTKEIVPQTFQLGLYNDSPALTVSDEMVWYLDGFSKTYSIVEFVDPQTKQFIEMSDAQAIAKYDKWQKDICSTLASKDTAYIALAIGVGLDAQGTEQEWIQYACNLLETYATTDANKMKVFGALKRTNNKTVKETTFNLK